MQLLTKISLFLIITFSLMSCEKDKSPLAPAGDDLMEMREIAWNSLAEREKDAVAGDWRDAEVTFGYYQNWNNRNFFVFEMLELGFALDSSDIILKNGQSIVSVRFNTTEDSLLGPIMIILSVKDKRAIGQMLRL